MRESDEGRPSVVNKHISEGDRPTWAIVTVLVACLLVSGVAAVSALDVCEYWVAPTPLGDDSNPGTASSPWATLTHAAATVPDDGCVVWIEDGVYNGPTQIERRFLTATTFRAVNPYHAVFQHTSTVFDIDGAMRVVIEGLEVRHTSAGSTGYVVIVDRSGDVWAEDIVLRNNIIHDSYDNDLLKIHNGVRFATVEGNVFYNQGPNEQHMDVNSVTDIEIVGNVFFNDFAGSGRTDPGDTKHFVLVKDSNEDVDGLLGSERVGIRRNVFLSWEGGHETFVKLGNDGKYFHEAKDITVESNLMIGDSPIETQAPFGIDGARDVAFVNNTVVGDFPSSAYAYAVGIKGFNPPNENVRFTNNVWSDPTGSMVDFSDGEPFETAGLVLDNNLYWNGGVAIPSGEPISPIGGDPRAVTGDPLLETDHTDIVVPRWTGTAFLSGSTSARAEFERLVQTYGAVPSGSPAIDAADPAFAPVVDILGNARMSEPDLGAYESSGVPNQPPTAADVVVVGFEDAPIDWTPIVSDPEAASVVCEIVDAPVAGTAVVAPDCSSGSFSAPPDSSGVFTFTYGATDGLLSSDAAQVSITVTPVPDPPIVVDDTVATDVDTDVAILVLENDSDPDGDLDPATVAIEIEPGHGSAQPNSDGSITYSPAAGYTGVDSFSYVVCDSANNCGSALVHVDVCCAEILVVAHAEVTVSGSVTGDITGTHFDDSVREELVEEHSGGRPAQRVSLLEHVWLFDVPFGDRQALILDAFRLPNAESDDFSVEFSVDGGSSFSPFDPPVVVTADSEGGPVLSIPFPTWVGGDVRIRVKDTDRSSGNGERDVLYVDLVAIAVSGAGDPPPAVSVEPGVVSVLEADRDIPASFVIRRSDAQGALTIGYSLTGDATPGEDYDQPPQAIELADGVLEGVIEVLPIDDELVEGDETVELTIDVSADYVVGTPSAATVVIADDDVTASREYFAVSDSTRHGVVVSGALDSTYVLDGRSQVIQEELFGGGSRSRLQHDWVFEPVGANPVLRVVAHHDGDEPFVMEFSPDGSTWTPLLEIGTDPGVVIEVPLGGSFSTVQIRLVDVNRDRGDGIAAMVSVDLLVVRTE